MLYFALLASVRCLLEQLVTSPHFRRRMDSSSAASIFTSSICIGITALEGSLPITLVQFNVVITIFNVSGLLAITLYRNWCGGRRAGVSSGVDVRFILRVLVFGVYIFFGMMCVANLRSFSSIPSYSSPFICQCEPRWVSEPIHRRSRHLRGDW
jgi:hypothetical protein